MNSTRRSFLLLALSALPLLPMACKPSEPPEQRIIILTNGNSPYWVACSTGAKDAAEEIGLKAEGYRVEIDRGDYTVQRQVDKLKGYLSSADVAAVAVSVVDPENLSIVEQMEKLRDKGVHVVTIDSDVAEEHQEAAREAYLGTNNVAAGRELGRAIRALRPDGSKYATFVGIKSAANAKERNAGLKEGLGAGSELIVNLENGQDTDTKPQENVKTAIDQHPDLDVLIGIWSYNTPAIVNVLQQRDKVGEYLVAAFDAEPQTIEGMTGETVDVMVVQNPYRMGYQSVKLLYALLEEKTDVQDEILPEGATIHDTGLRIVVPDAESAVKDDLFDEGTEFMTLEELQAWLREHNLQGS